MTKPGVTRASWTFELEANCIYCGKKCKRTRTFDEPNFDEASKRAVDAMEHIAHRKCGGF